MFDEVQESRSAISSLSECTILSLRECTIPPLCKCVIRDVLLPAQMHNSIVL